MVYPQPIVTRDMTAYPDSNIRTTVSCAVFLIDEVTGTSPQGSVRVHVDKGQKMPIKNVSGYHVFMDLDEGDHVLMAESQYYFPDTHVFSVPFPDPLNPVLERILKPMPCYPFPDNATLVRGVVKPCPVPPASVRTVGLPETWTDGKGEFALYFTSIPEGFITIEITRGHDMRRIAVAVDKGKTKNAGIIEFP